MNHIHSAVDPCLDTSNFCHLINDFRDRGEAWIIWSSLGDVLKKKKKRRNKKQSLSSLFLDSEEGSYKVFSLDSGKQGIILCKLQNRAVPVDIGCRHGTSDGGMEEIRRFYCENQKLLRTNWITAPDGAEKHSIHAKPVFLFETKTHTIEENKNHGVVALQLFSFFWLRRWGMSAWASHSLYQTNNLL